LLGGKKIIRRVIRNCKNRLEIYIDLSESETTVQCTWFLKSALIFGKVFLFVVRPHIPFSNHRAHASRNISFAIISYRLICPEAEFQRGSLRAEVPSLKSAAGCGAF
jgi:hypothetical protein